MSIQMDSRLQAHLQAEGYAFVGQATLAVVMPPPSVLDKWKGVDGGTSLLSVFEVADPLTGARFELRQELRLQQSYISTILKGDVFAYDVHGRDYPVAVGRANIRSWLMQGVNSAVFQGISQGCAAAAAEETSGELELTTRLLTGLSVAMMP